MSFSRTVRRRGSAPVARERLQILLSYERASRGQSDLLAILREEILSAITKHVTVERDSVQVRMDRGPSVSTLAIDVEIPHSNGRTFLPPGRERATALLHIRNLGRVLPRAAQRARVGARDIAAMGKFAKPDSVFEHSSSAGLRRVCCLNFRRRLMKAVVHSLLHPTLAVME